MPVCPSCHASYDAAIRICPTDGTPLPIEAAPDALIGQLLEGKYRVDAFISAGGMGSVYRATHVMLDKTVAVKLIRKEVMKTAEASARFQREARAVSNLEHPNIAAVFDFGQTRDGTLYIAMEYVEGPSLKEVIQRDGPMDTAQIVAILGPVAGALARAHRHHIIHRDLKPHNIMLATDKDGRRAPKLLDFGIAKTADASASALTLTGYALGTPQYMSPEQATGQPVDGRSDLYSLGVVLYEMLIGEVPFADTSVAGVLLKQMTALPDAPSRRRPDAHISPVLEAIALRCLDKNPDHRFQSAEAFLAALSKADASAMSAVDAPTIRTPAVDLVPGTATPTMPLPRDKAAGAASRAIRPSALETTPAASSSSPNDSAEQTAQIIAPPAHGVSGQATPEPPGDPLAPRPTASALATSDEAATGVVKPGTQPTVVAPAPAQGPPFTPSTSSAAPGPMFWLTAVAILIAVVGSGAWVIRTWAPPFAETTPPAQAPTATPAMAQSAPAVEAAPAIPPADPASGSQSKEPPTAPPPDSTAATPGAASSPVTRAGEMPPVPGGMKSAVPSTPQSAAAPFSSPPALAPDAGAPLTAPPASAAGAPPPRSSAASRDVSAQPAADTDTATQPARERTDPPVARAGIGNPTVFVQCNGPSEICSPVRSAMADALRKERMPMATVSSRADVTLSVDVELVEQRVQQSFGTTFAPRTYSAEVNGEAHGAVVPMPPARTFSFDAQVGRERANENARLIAADAVGKVRDFWNQRP